MIGFDDISQRVHPQLVLTSLPLAWGYSPATQGGFADNFRDFAHDSVGFREISTTQGSSLTLMTSLRTWRSLPITQLSSPITQGALAHNYDEVMDNSWKFVNKSEDCSNTGEVAEKRGKFSDDPKDWAAFKGVWMILSSFGLWLISNVVVLFEMVLFDSNGLVWFQFFFFQISESCADISWYRSTPDSFMRFVIAQSNFEKFFPLWMVPLIARDCFWVHF